MLLRGFGVEPVTNAELVVLRYELLEKPKVVELLLLKRMVCDTLKGPE